MAIRIPFLRRKKRKAETFSLGNPQAGVKEYTPTGKEPSASNISNPAYNLPGVKPLPADAPVNKIIPKESQPNQSRGGSSKRKVTLPGIPEAQQLPFLNEQNGGVGQKPNQISPFIPPSPQQIKETAYLKSFYGGKGASQSNDYLIRKARIEAYSSPTQQFKSPYQRGTLSYGEGLQTTQTKYIRQTDYAIAASNIKYNVAVSKEKEKAEERIKEKAKRESLSEDYLTQEQKAFNKFQKAEAAKQELALNKELKVIEKELYPEKKKLINYDTDKAQRYFYNKGLPVSIIKTGVGAASFSAGAVNAVYQNKKEIAKELAIGAGITIGTAGLGSAAVALGASAKAVNVGGKIISYGSLGFYGYNTGKNIARSRQNKFYSAGQTLALDLAPFYTGSKIAGYGVRRFNLAQELKMQTESLPKEQRLKFMNEMVSAKELLNVNPKVKDLNLEGMERIPSNAQKPIISFLSKKRNVVVGGSVAQRTQLYVPESKPPSDLDVYVKGLFQDIKSKYYGWSLAKELKKAGVGRVSSSPSVSGQITIGGQKAIEFHSFDSYLKANLEQVLPWYRTASYGLTKTPSGVKVQKISLQLQRKLVGGYLEPERASKDLPAAAAIKESLLRTKELQERQNRLIKNENLMKTINDFNRQGGLFKDVSYKTSYKPYAEYKPYSSYKGYKGYKSYSSYSSYKPFAPPLNTSYNPKVSIPKIQNPRSTPYNKSPTWNVSKFTFTNAPYITSKIKRESKGMKIGSGEILNKIEKKLEDAYRVILKKGNREEEVPGLFGRGEALYYGEKKTLSSLYARFKIKKTGFKIEKKWNDYKVNTKLFRPYKIRNRKPIPLIDEFIQRKTKRLVTPSEVAEIQRSRRRL